jgi:hypothetical protein
MSTKKTIAATSTKTVEAKESKGTFVSFYNNQTREHLTKVYRISDTTGKSCVGEVKVSRTQKREKDAERVTYSYLKIQITRPIGGVDTLVKELSIGIAAKTGALYVRENEIEKPEAAQPTTETV